MNKKLGKPASSDVISSKGDDYGNLIVCKNNGTRVVLLLKLVAETKHRRLGVINIARKTIEIKRDKHKHLFLANNSYGFNELLIKDAKKFNKVRLSDQYNEWLIPNSFILENGSYMNHLKKGFELQLFVPLTLLEQFKRPAKF